MLANCLKCQHISAWHQFLALEHYNKDIWIGGGSISLGSFWNNFGSCCSTNKRYSIIGTMPYQRCIFSKQFRALQFPYNTKHAVNMTVSATLDILCDFFNYQLKLYYIIKTIF